MWSGPRNISTALMRAWGNRPDAFVTDEPLYAHYLQVTGLPHPGAEEVIRCHDPDWRRVVAWLTGDVPGGKTLWYQKQMAHHLLPQIDRGWLSQVTNCFLIRDPREMLTSLLHFIPVPTLADTGLPQQVEIFRLVQKQLGRTPAVVDARDVLDHPREVLTKLCAALDVEFTEAMLSWAPGLRPTDGVWAKHWYKEVEQTTSFRPYKPKAAVLPEELYDVYEQCIPLFEELADVRLTG